MWWSVEEMTRECATRWYVDGSSVVSVVVCWFLSTGSRTTLIRLSGFPPDGWDRKEKEGYLWCCFRKRMSKERGKTENSLGSWKSVQGVVPHRTEEKVPGHPLFDRKVIVDKGLDNRNDMEFKRSSCNIKNFEHTPIFLYTYGLVSIKLQKYGEGEDRNFYSFSFQHLGISTFLRTPYPGPFLYFLINSPTVRKV